jgi:hypothetical protein
MPNQHFLGVNHWHWDNNPITFEASSTESGGLYLRINVASGNITMQLSKDTVKDLKDKLENWLLDN